MHRTRALALLAACLLAIGCGEKNEPIPTPPPKPGGAIALQPEPEPNICVATCSDSPTIEPLGQLCHLQSSSCKNGVRTCIYHCEVIETHEPIELEIRSRKLTPEEIRADKDRAR